MSEPEHYPGLFQTAEGGWMTHKDFLSFIGGASPGESDTTERAMAWLRRQGVTGPIESLSPEDVSRLCAAAQKIILARKDREKHEHR